MFTARYADSSMRVHWHQSVLSGTSPHSSVIFFWRSVVFSTSATFGSRQEVVKNFSQQCSVSRQSTSITGLCHQSERPYQCGSEEASCERRAKDPEKHNGNCQPQISGRGNNKPKRSGIDDPSAPQSAARNAAERDSRKACWPRRVVAKRPWERMFNSRSFQQFQDQSVVRRTRMCGDPRSSIEWLRPSALRWAPPQISRDCCR